MRLTRLIYAAFLSLTLLGFSFGGPTQKYVNESCSSDSDCRSSHCVNVKGGDRKCSDCEQSKLDDLTRTVDERCKDFDSGIFGYSDLVREFGSKNEVSLVRLNYRARYVRECLDARTNREHTCWNDGDSGHKTQIEELRKTLNYLQGLIDDKTRYNLGYTCEPDRYEDTQEDIDDNCKGVDSLFEKYGMNDGKEVSCSDINELIQKCMECREALADMIDDCFRNGAPSDRVKRLADMRDMEKIAKEKKDKGCK
jgi:hypothetical protein